MATMPPSPPQHQEENGQPSTMAQESQVNSAQDARFSCNICLDPVVEPVVTRCGHLYCWPCLYRWLLPGMTLQEKASLGLPRVFTAPMDQSRRVCPVCKAECSVPTVVPIYVRNASSTKPPPEQSQPAVEEFLDHYSDDDMNMGLDIDDDYFYGDDDYRLDENEPAIPTTVITDAGSSLGLRQRRRWEETAMVPTRPVPSRGRTATAETHNSSLSSTADVPTPNHHARATLSYGLVRAMHQTLLHVTNGHSDAAVTANATAEETIPSLHYPQQRRDSSMEDTGLWDQDPASTLFLSRLLLGLSLFVLFCLFSF